MTNGTMTLNQTIWGATAALVSVFSALTVGAETFNEKVKRSIAFVCKGTNAVGTGFWVGVPSPVKDKFPIYFFVTAKHVLWEDEKVQLDGFFVRYDGPGGPKYGKLSGFQVITHPDPMVDIVAIRAAPSDAKSVVIPLNLITTREEFTRLSIEEGDDVFFVGLFTSMPERKKNLPVFRFGHVAMVQDEIPQSFIVEVQSYPGNSGAPVFFDHGVVRRGLLQGKTEGVRLAGVMRGYYFRTQKNDIIEAKSQAITTNNIGLASVTPSFLPAGNVGELCGSGGEPERSGKSRFELSVVLGRQEFERHGNSRIGPSNRNKRLKDANAASTRCLAS
jgi:hypothetical protein